MRRIVIVGALILGSCVATQQHPEEALLNSRHAALVETPFSMGTGFPITDEAWLTAWHVVEGWDAEDVTIAGFAVLEIKRCGDLDTCVLITALHGRTPWPLADRLARAGERVYKSGYGQGLHWWSEGLATEDGERISLDMFPGDSGGPVFDARGDVLAIIVAVGMSRSGTIEHHCWVVPMVAILDAMPEGVMEGADEPLTMPPGPLPVEETPWERF